MKHTPGPWRVEEGTTLVWGACDSDDTSTFGMGYPIVTGCRSHSVWAKGHPSDEEQQANVRLIAAAPELLEILIKICAIQESGDVASWAPEWDCARAAIAKATTP